MGPKITIDSATLANKGLELIEAHFLFGLPYDRIEVVVHPTSIVHALVRFRDGAALAHLGYPDMRVPISYALTYPERAATPVPPLDLAAGLTLEFQRARPRDVPAARARARGGRARRHLSVRLQRRERGRRRGVPRRPAAVPRHRRDGRETLLADVDGAPGTRPRRAGRGRREARARSPKECWRPHEHLHRDPRPRVPDPRPRGRPLLRGARASACGRAKFYVGFPPALVKRTRNGIEYGIGAIPLGGYVKIPGMHRPAAGDVDAHFGPATAEAPELAGPLERLRRALDGGRPRRRARGARRARRASSRLTLSPLAARGSTAASASSSDALGPDAYWRAATWKRIAVIFAGPGANIVLRGRPLRDPLPRRRRQGDDDRRRRSSRGTPATAAGLQPGDGIVAIDGVAGHARTRSRRGSRARRASRCTLIVERDGRTVTLGPVRAQSSTRAATGSASSSRGEGLGVAESAWQSVHAHRRSSRRRSAPRSAASSTGEGREGHLEPGRDRRRARPRRSTQGTENYLWVLGADQPVARAAEPAAAAAARRRPHRVLARRGHPRPRGRARGLRARLGGRDRARRCCSSSSASRTTSAGSAARLPLARDGQRAADHASAASRSAAARPSSSSR